MTQFEEEKAELCARVDLFAAYMKTKLKSKLALGYHGWKDADMREVIENELLYHAAKLVRGDTGQAVDVANLAMFLFGQEDKP